jgi:CHAT domain-containing protein
MTMIRIALLATTAALSVAATSAHADMGGLSTRDTFRVGDAGVLCSAQYAPGDARLSGIFDRGYQLVCRDAAGAVGSLLAVRGNAPAVATTLSCEAPGTEALDALGTVASQACKDVQGGLDYRRYQVSRGNVTYVAEGLAGYDSVLRLGLASLVADRAVPGKIEVATTLVSDPTAFARVQAGQLDARGARREAYGRNNGGSYAQAAAFFESLAARQTGDASSNAEFVANQGLQQSNLGNFATAEALFDKAMRLAPQRDGVIQRMVRNFRAINALNHNRPEEAISAIDIPVDPVLAGRDADLANGNISTDLARVINREVQLLKSLGGIEAGLTPEDRAAILDGQALQLRGSAFRQRGKPAEAQAALTAANEAIAKVRDGRVTSIGWLRAQTLAELSAVSEALGDTTKADAYLTQAIGIYQTEYPASPALLAAQAKRAAYLSRSGRGEEAIALFGAVIEQSEGVDDAASALRDLVRPYFDLLAGRDDGDSATAFFRASQIMQRPGVAQTQAVLARELSEGNDEASTLFRLSLSRSRDVVRTSADIAALSGRTDLNAAEATQLKQSQEALEILTREQTALQSKLAAFPKYRAAAPTTLTLAELQGTLKAGEAYYKVTLIGDGAYAQFITPSGARSFRLPATTADLSASVAAIRDTIVKMENGVPVTEPFDLKTARSLFKTLFEPVEKELAATKHLVFEPDGPLLQLPPQVLVTDDDGIKAYDKRMTRRGADDFDFRGIAWLGRDRAVSIAVSPRSFTDVRAIAPSRGKRSYLGLGQNAPASTRPVMAVADECDWPIETWQNPISSAELKLANSIIGKGTGTVLTDGAFADSELAGRTDLRDYRILHFATHGLVTAPRPECPARPALVTSFGGGNSDGLLSFREVFDMKLDADLVILSACDTAGVATAAATREAGIATGGNYALDGLVRAFVGAGARSVVASHWPVPDDFNATQRLVGGLFSAKPGQALGDALVKTQMKLMDDVQTSHPFYWAAFVVLGDAEKPLVAR